MDTPRNVGALVVSSELHLTSTKPWPPHAASEFCPFLPNCLQALMLSTKCPIVSERIGLTKRWFFECKPLALPVHTTTMPSPDGSDEAMNDTGGQLESQRCRASNPVHTRSKAERMCDHVPPASQVAFLH